jgi:hypothetical protein
MSPPSSGSKNKPSKKLQREAGSNQSREVHSTQNISEPELRHTKGGREDERLIGQGARTMEEGGSGCLRMRNHLVLFPSPPPPYHGLPTNLLSRFWSNRRRGIGLPIGFIAP